MRERIHPRTPFVPGFSPLLTEADRPGVNALIDKLEADLRHAITTRIPEFADPLFDRGYRADELLVSGFGPEIEVHPKKTLHPARLWCRRILVKLRIRKHPAMRNYAVLECEVHDTRRLIDGLKLFANQGGAQLP